jgi:alkanesulfonate monooxygenase SsuD/methylene tetrahydromethanopterin reductase-like flavin-dependent oxidoreductase (luciferase family)
VTPPQLGLVLSGQHPPGHDAAAAVRDHLAQVALARELGFASVWTSQHFLPDGVQYLQSVPLLARVAAEAEGMTLGTAVLLLTLLNPVEVAEQAATLDAIAGGRFVLGVGIGYHATENAAFGVTTHRARLFERKLAVVRALLAGEAVTASGPGFALEAARLTLRPAVPPPIWLAANGDAAVARAARLGDAWLVNPHARLEELERQMALYRAARTSPPTATPVFKEVCVAATDEAAHALARPHLEGKYASYVASGQSDVLPPTDTLRREFAELTAGGRFVIGSPATCAAILAAHVDRLGADQLLCRVQWPGMPQAAALESIRLLAREVLPALSP